MVGGKKEKVPALAVSVIKRVVEGRRMKYHREDTFEQGVPASDTCGGLACYFNICRHKAFARFEEKFEDAREQTQQLLRSLYP